MRMNKFYFNEHKLDMWKYDWLVGHIISISLAHMALFVRLESTVALWSSWRVKVSIAIERINEAKMLKNMLMLI